MKRVDPCKSGHQVRTEITSADLLQEIFPVYMENDEPAHYEEEIHHQVAFFKKQAYPGRNESCNRRLKMENRYKERSYSAQRSQTGQIRDFLGHGSQK